MTGENNSQVDVTTQTNKNQDHEIQISVYKYQTPNHSQHSIQR